MKRIAIIDNEKCMNKRGCNLICAKYCPINKTGSACISENELTSKAKIDEETCIGCNICVKRCPFGAIKIVNLPQELDKDPIFRYQENGFSLYNIPLPQNNKIIGILGRNGIGKSTAIKILNSNLELNFGNLEKKATIEDYKEYFKGSEVMNYLNKLYNKELSISYKPQNIKTLPEVANGTIKELLSKYPNYLKVLEKLDLKDVIDRDIKVLSGGELQRLAIAATMLKEADIYILDEPSSYLDIKQRLNLCGFLKEELNEKKSIIVIEHDLIVLDYLCDLIHITFGEPGAYGVFSALYTSKVGINSFLGGFLKNENIRFRDFSISFLKSLDFISKKKEIPIIEWKNSEIKKGDFKLKIKEGIISKYDIVGILGENGTGKSTFMDNIASKNNNLISNEDIKDLKISYKNQYIEGKNGIIVKDFLKEAVANNRNDLVTPLNVDTLLEKDLGTLSGGELQRVMITKCLSDKEADIYLLDEPSAYLDVEQKVVLGKIIKDFSYNNEKPLFIIDHDLMLMDYICNKLIVFKGKPGIECETSIPLKIDDGMNLFLKDIGITFRRDEHSFRPRPNKKDSQIDQEMKKKNKYY
ncbi:MAG: ribosome biogenesis/translation initiation ATPase RLI [Candidatus Nanoarchaeia archaeon]|nr:ribosome biogenesis/translation initiation ATPase RLI [Candidatus Nanoarchaeia archaeon]